MKEETKVKLIVFVFLLIFGGIGAYVFYSFREPPSEAIVQTETQTSPEITKPKDTRPTAVSPTPKEIEHPAPVKLPELTEEQIQELAKQLSASPDYSSWLLTRHLLPKFAAVIDNIANGRSPRKLVPFLAPEGRFEVFEKDEQEILDPKSYERYDKLVEVFVSLDTNSCAKLFERLRPQLDRAHAELGVPGNGFKPVLGKAFGELLRVPIVEGDIPLERIEVNLKIAIAELESLSDAQKHLFRMGPDNIRKVQAKLREIGNALGFRDGTWKKPAVVQ